MFDAFVKNTLAPLLLRLCLAAVFIFHGMALVREDWGTNWHKPTDNGAALPMPAQAAVAWGQLLGGVAMVLGLLTRLAALGLAAIMAGAIATVHWPHGFDIREGGCEYNVALIVMCVVLMLTGGGKLAADRMFRVKPRV
jgi:putative oxidoreductase